MAIFPIFANWQKCPLFFELRAFDPDINSLRYAVANWQTMDKGNDGAETGNWTKRRAK